MSVKTEVQTFKTQEFKMKVNTKTIEALNQDELAQVKGGNEEREYIIVIIDGKSVKIYI